MIHLKPLPTANRSVFVASFFLAIGIVAALATGGLVAQQSTTRQSQIQKWVDGLGADDYLMRLKSEDEIIRIGSTAIDAIENATQSTDIEIRIRANRLLVELLDQDFQNRKLAFVDADPGDKNDFGFTRWNSFREIVGGSVESKKLFIRIVEHRRWTSGGRRQGRAVDHFGYFSDSSEPYTPLPSTAIEIADELLFQITSKQRRKTPADQGVVIEQLTLSGFEANLPITMVNIVNESRYKHEIKQLMKRWIVAIAGDNRLNSNQIEIIYQFELSGFTNELADVLRAEGAPRRMAAAEAIAKTGGSDAVSVLSKFISGNEVVVVYPQPELGAALPVTIGDVAFQLILDVQEIPRKDFGLLPTVGTMLLSDSPVSGFADRVSAKTAIDRWRLNRR